jgi:epsin
MIYKRFTEKSAEEWRQIYKALQLLEFLIKNGSERVIDDARSHLTLIKMLRQFHYIDQNGKDQGINVRNRAKELAELLGDVERIRTERKKARATRSKYTGVEGGAGLGGGLSSGSRYGGFGSEEGGASGSAGYGGYSGGVFGDGGGFGGQQSDFQDNAGGRRADQFEEYDEFDDGGAVAARPAASSRRAGVERSTAKAKAPAPAKPKAPEVDLFSFDEPEPATTSAAAGGATDDDEFDDFQSATPVPAAAPLQSPRPAQTASTNSFTQFASPQPVSAPKQADLSSMMNLNAISPAPSSTSTPGNYSAFSPPSGAQPLKPAPSAGFSGPNYFTSVQVPTAGGPTSAPLAPKSATGAASQPAKKSGDAFGSLWTQASAGIKKANTPTQGPALGQLAKEKASAGIWGTAGAAKPAAPAQNGSQPQQSAGGNGLDDLLL